MSIYTDLIDNLEILRFMEKNENIIFIGTSGVGETHLAVSIGMAAAKRRISTYYITFNDLINQLLKANSENRADIKIKGQSYRIKDRNINPVNIEKEGD